MKDICFYCCCLLIFFQIHTNSNYLFLGSCGFNFSVLLMASLLCLTSHGRRFLLRKLKKKCISNRTLSAGIEQLSSKPDVPFCSTLVSKITHPKFISLLLQRTHDI
ncbi:hypothetical protein SAY86_022951 [Trapa natans]|uniref:Uncharacterized protein n=1 Tax=Trapa natans TaxID=22666 RepID=A0AAN7M9L5_TRANT|nr:hypothetical protein SAY86_022951 [Trapa natans]